MKKSKYLGKTFKAYDGEWIVTEIENTPGKHRAFILTHDDGGVRIAVRVVDGTMAKLTSGQRDMSDILLNKEYETSKKIRVERNEQFVYSL